MAKRFQQILYTESWRVEWQEIGNLFFWNCCVGFFKVLKFSSKRKIT